MKYSLQRGLVFIVIFHFKYFMKTRLDCANKINFKNNIFVKYLYHNNDVIFPSYSQTSCTWEDIQHMLYLSTKSHSSQSVHIRRKLLQSALVLMVSVVPSYFCTPSLVSSKNYARKNPWKLKNSPKTPTDISNFPPLSRIKK